MINKKYAFLFDLDGTLIDSKEVHLLCFLDALNELDLKSDKNIEKIFSEEIGKTSTDILISIFGNLPKEIVEKFKELKSSSLSKYVDRIKIIKPTYDFLLKLKEKNIPCALVTSSSKKTVDIISKVIPIYSLFDVVITADDVIYGKPDPEPFLKAYYKLREKYHSNFEKVFFIGDTIYDKIGAEKAGFKFIYYKDIEKIRSDLSL